MATPRPIFCWPDMARITRRSPCPSPSLPDRHAMRPLGLLAGGVGADDRSQGDEAGVDRDLAAADVDREPVESPGGGPTLFLADAVVLRPVAGTLEPLRRLAPRHPAAQVHALLVEGD